LQRTLRAGVLGVGVTAAVTSGLEKALFEFNRGALNLLAKGAVTLSKRTQE